MVCYYFYFKDRLDKDLMIAHMQGKFVLKILSIKVGHCLQEDSPEETSIQILSFLNRFNL
jgi:protein phosphatase methylesterase 1